MPKENVYNFGLVRVTPESTNLHSYTSSILGFKISLLLMYLRFMTKGAARTTTIAFIIACVLFHLSFLLVQSNLCQPAVKQWDPRITWGRCLPAVPFYTSMASLMILFDITVMLLPFPVLLRSHDQKRKKVALLGLLALGTFITIIHVIRIRTVKNLANYLDSANLILWSTVETNLGIIVASIPTLGPLLKYYAEKTPKGYTANSNSHPRSLYALKPRYGTREGSFPLGSGGAGSEEFILCDVATITNRTEVTISTCAKEGPHSVMC
ncbi:uncharacterized protein K460DRAFT_384006 [Cucurbitaria berberidis CBS 394.84]|uniref:Rhodopsin domain-containing protein n=1 Tax=Cucurbitaria berberidis CBS 394.84 TaxID=1168544 RepID=A0A9P4GM05_9PLEO|nr:uncharacterized protein K460DRAFT_384006 [Cucurbitaria berberidis CBS 394.84]KAF1847677.1 hypothetical protein K460DRAFT_384006 [Cucurbitaria berberidis CBS 394.84]